MASYKTAFGSYLKTEDIEARGGRVNCVIERVAVETIKGMDGKPDENKPVAHIRNSDKRLALNRTRCEQLESIFGTDDMDNWMGPVAIVVGSTKYQGRMVKCMDVQPRSTQAAPPPPPPPPPSDPASGDITDDDIPFAWVLPFLLPALTVMGTLA